MSLPPFETSAVSADELYADYHSNEAKAGEKYTDKYVVVSGNVADVGKGIAGQPYVIVGGIASGGGCHCVFPDSAMGDISGLSKGDVVSVKGRVVSCPDRMLMEDGVLQ